MVTSEQALPTIDGVSLPAEPLTMMRNGDYAKQVRIIVGSNTNDASLFVYGFPAFDNLTASKFTGLLNASLFVDGKEPDAGALERLVALYPASQDPNVTRASSLNHARLVEFGTDNGFACPMRWVAQAAAKHSSPVYLYRFNHAWPHARCSDLYFGPPWGVTHTAEISYVFGMPTFVFGKPAAPQNCSMGEDEQDFARRIGGAWVALSSSDTGEEPWPGYNTSTEGLGALLQPGPGGHWQTEAGWRAAFCDRLARQAGSAAL